MANSFFGLWHDIIICSNNDNDQVGYLSSACTHCSKCLVTRSVQKGDFLSALQIYTVCTDVLGNTTRFICGYICFSDVVEQRGFSVINMTHHGHNWRTSHQIIRVFLWLVYCFFDICSDKLNGISELLRHD